VTQGRLVRAASPRVLLGQGQVFLFGPRDGAQAEAVCALEGDHADLVLAVLEHAGEALARDDIVQRVLAEAGADTSLRPAVDQAIDLLEKWGALVAAPRATELAIEARLLQGAHVAVCITGAIGAVYTPPFVERLVAAGHEVRVAMTPSARRFISARSFRAITHRPVATSLWKGTPREPAPHVAIARWADVVVVYPCTATTLGRLASGDCSELVSAIATTTRAPVLLVPSMNLEMWRAPAVTENLARLRAHGFFVAHPGSGLEVADAPAERVRRGGVAAPAVHVTRYVGWLVERALGAGPRVLSRAEWDAEHDRHAVAPVEDDIARALDAHAPSPARVLEVGTGLGAVARAAAKRGHVVVATDFSRRAIARAQAVDPEAAVTWVVDDATDTSLRGPFDVCIDRGCFGCIPVARRERYAEGIASLVRPGGVLVLEVHLAPARHIRAFGFTREEVTALFEPWFSAIAVRESTLGFGELAGSPALLFELRRRG
jgi:SAM-dependent methyltransferase/3-polyprenyl-4-hydroxybenzoate decarboxylase